MRWGTAIIAALAPLLVSATAPREWVVRGDGAVSGSINGIPARLMIDPGATAMPMITSTIARRAGLKPSFFDFEYQVGPQRVIGESAVGHIDVGAGPDKRRIGWADRPWRAGVDGVIGPGMLPHDTIRFELRAPRPGETRTAFPLVSQGGIDGKWGERFARIALGGRTLRIQFDPHSETTLATAQAGALIAQTLGGRFAGAPRQAVVAFGIARPVRRVMLDRPLVVGTLHLREFEVRTGDFGSASGIAETAASADPAEIVVIGRTKAKAAYDQIKLGRDVLDRCSSITFERKAERLTLSCL